MLKTGNGDFITFIIFFALGAAFCLFCDLFIAFRASVKCGAITVFFQDVFCFALFGFVSFVALFIRTNGEARWFAFAGITAGFCALQFTVNKYIKRALIKIFRLIFTLLKRVFTVVVKVYGFFEKNFFEKSEKILKKLLKKCKSMLYNTKDN